MIKDHWHGVWADGVDAAVPWTNGKVYFFKGAEYIQYDVKGDTTDPGFPKPIKGNWPGLEKLGGENGIDAVICWNATTAYFFKGDQYVRYNMAETDNNKKVSGPFPIKGNWPHVKWEKG